MLDLVQEYQELITTIGLALNVTGSVIFIIDSKRLSGVLSTMVKHIAAGHEKHGASIPQERIYLLQKKVSQSGILTALGFSLFLGGFLMQLIPRLVS